MKNTYGIINRIATRSDQMSVRYATWICSLAIFSFAVLSSQAEEGILVPEIDGEWWHIAGNPDLGRYNSDEQEPTAFGLWQAADGTWQLWGCIRKTNVGGNTRLFYRWQSNSITDPDWEPKGIAMTAKPDVGETLGGLQTPHATKLRDEYLMVYGDWESICLARSKDGKMFERQINRDGKAGMFNEGLGNSTRDAMITLIDDTYYIYYTANPGRKGAVYCRTSKDLKTWSDSRIVSSGGSAGEGWTDAEVPYVLYHPEAQAYYLFRTHSPPDGEGDYITSVYRSNNPLDFGIGNDDCLVTTIDAEASWIISDEGRYYIAAVMPGLKGYRVARLKWVNRDQLRKKKS